MAQWSAFRPLTSAGAIRPDMLPAGGFQLSWMLQWLLDPVEDMGGMTRHRGFWRWQVLAPDGTVLFDSEVDIYGTAVWMPGTAGLVAWYIQINSSNPDVVTTVPIRPPMDGIPSNASSWHQRSDGTWQNDGEQGYIGEESWEDAAGAGGFGRNNEFPVYSIWFSARYMVPLPEGATIHLHQGAGGEMFQVPRLYRCQISTVDAGGRFGTMYDDPGFHRVVLPVGRRTVHRFSGDSVNYLTRTVPHSLYNATVVKEPTNTLVVGGKFAQVGWIIQRSDDDGLTWRSVYELAFDATFTDGRIAMARDGATVAIARKAGYLYCRSSRDGFVQTIRIGQALTAMEIACHPQSGALLVTDGKTLTYTSRDNGLSWERTRWDVQ